MLILEPLAPDTTIDLKLLYSDSDFWAEEPVLSRASLRMRFTWFSNVCRRVFPGVGSSSLLCAFSMTWCKRRRNSQGDIDLCWSLSLSVPCPLRSSSSKPLGASGSVSAQPPFSPLLHPAWPF